MAQSLLNPEPLLSGLLTSGRGRSPPHLRAFVKQPPDGRPLPLVGSAGGGLRSKPDERQVPAPVPCGSGVSPCRGLGQSCAFPTGFPGPTGVAGPSPRPAPSPRASVSPPPLPPFRVWKALSAPLHEWPELCRGRGEDGGPSAGPQSSHWRPHTPSRGPEGAGGHLPSGPWLSHAL